MPIFAGKPRSRWLFVFFFLAVSIGLLSLAQSPPQADPWDEPELGCTSIMAGRLATTDGSVMTAHTCDGNYRQWLNIVPHAQHYEGGTTKVFTGKMHTETSTDPRNVTEKGEVPDVKETYAFLNTAYPCLNEHQLAIGETTIGGKKELFNMNSNLVFGSAGCGRIFAFVIPSNHREEA